MESNRAGYSIKKLSINNRGISLFSAILIALFALLALAGLYFALTKLLGTAQTIKTYASVRDAAVGGIHHAVIMIQSGSFNEYSVGECTSSPIELKFKLYGSNTLFRNNITVCLNAYKTPPGYEITGVAYSKFGAGYKGFIYTIISEAEGPESTHSRIEAVYAR
ncbi:hypothetical protein [Thermodesulfovibrio yellowstonii]|uniref:hypothetical protein n=1 Tax=Thermodesulfovibrio yellowstonii TaxID=28262 RepID=UPI0024B38181|nr:hypothetical protein [Thermodesulfovibrio yellowstonii]MDI6864310.1 hypothetical protein [Thermodesulfovibrio yellowstonii]